MFSRTLKNFTVILNMKDYYFMHIPGLENMGDVFSADYVVKLEGMVVGLQGVRRLEVEYSINHYELNSWWYE